MNQDAAGVQWLRVQEAWKKSAPLFALFYLSSLVASPSVSFFFSHLLLYLYTLVTKVLLFYLSAPVTFSYGGPCLKCCLVTWWVVTCLLPNCVSTAPGCLPACSSATLFEVPFLKITSLGIDEDFKQCPFALPSSSSCFFCTHP